MSDNKSTGKLLREANLELTKQKFFSIWLAHKKLIISAIAGFLLAIVIIVSFLFYSQGQKEKYSAILHQSLIDLSEDKREKARAALKGIYEDNSAPKGVKLIGGMRYAVILLEDGKIDEAVQVYLKVNNDGGDDYMSELAGLKALKTLIDANQKKYEAQIVDLIAKLEKNSVILKYYIDEQKAIFEWNQGNFKIAKHIFKNLARNSEVPDTIARRSKQMLEVYRSKYPHKKLSSKEGGKK